MAHGIGGVAGAEGLIEPCWPAKHRTQFICLALFASRCGPCVGMGVHLAVKRGDRTVHGSAVGRAMGILAVELDPCGATAVASRGHSVGLQIVQKALNLSNVYLLGGLGATDHFWWVDLGRLGTSVGLVPLSM